MSTTRSVGDVHRKVGAWAIAALVALSACGQGGVPAVPGSPPAPLKAHKASLTSGANCPETGAHTRHLNLFACSTCHPTGATFGFDVPYTFTGGTTTAGGTITPRTATTPTTCTVACHFPKGAPTKSVAWDAPGPLACVECHATPSLPSGHPAVSANATRADCQGCHTLGGHLDGAVTLVAHAASWMNQASPEFHAAGANAGLRACQDCHGVDLTGGATTTSCAQCHDVGLPVGVASWKVNCVMCHGGTDSQTGAPPVATWGNAGDAVRIGAHTQHGAGSSIAPAYDCGVCHVKPADALAGGHLDGGTADLTFSGIATARNATPAWDRATATCSNVYCHGGTMGGGTRTAPVWTRVGQGEADCGTCHGLPPPSPHPTASADLTRCTTCHPDTMNEAGSVIAPSAGGKHLDGLIQASGGHPGGWMDTASAGFHAYSANAGLAGCQGCHGVNLDGVGGSATTSCATCHGATWRTSCLMCHGGNANTTGAPPSGTWGHETDPLRIGAHTAHVTTSTTKLAYDCTACHVKPTDALGAGHMDGQMTTVTWGALARTGGANPSWDRATGTCASTYCHGNYSGTYAYTIWDWGSESLVEVSVPYSGPAATPSWSATGLTCTACHGNPPANYYWHMGHGGGCDLCHPDANADGTAVTDPTKHVNGVIDLAPQYISSCFGCH
jgi:predicted CxxxxCH...CXXCH cytochrome family protein